MKLIRPQLDNWVYLIEKFGSASTGQWEPFDWYLSKLAAVQALRGVSDWTPRSVEELGHELRRRWNRNPAAIAEQPNESFPGHKWDRPERIQQAVLHYVA